MKPLSYILLSLCLSGTLSVNAQRNGISTNSIPVPNGVTLAQQKVVREVHPDNKSLPADRESRLAIRYDTVYKPVKYNRNGFPTELTYEVVPVKTEPPVRVLHDTMEVLTAMITLPRLDDIEIYKVYFRLGENRQQGYSLLNTVFQSDNPASGPIEMVQTEDFTLIVLNLGKEVAGRKFYFGEVVLESLEGVKSPAFRFSTDQLIGCK